MDHLLSAMHAMPDAAFLGHIKYLKKNAYAFAFAYAYAYAYAYSYAYAYA